MKNRYLDIAVRKARISALQIVMLNRADPTAEMLRSSGIKSDPYDPRRTIEVA